jgi:hypothetical protein
VRFGRARAAACGHPSSVESRRQGWRGAAGRERPATCRAGWAADSIPRLCFSLTAVAAHVGDAGGGGQLGRGAEHGVRGGREGGGSSWKLGNKSGREKKRGRLRFLGASEEKSEGPTDLDPPPLLCLTAIDRTFPTDPAIVKNKSFMKTGKASGQGRGGAALVV